MDASLLLGHLIQEPHRGDSLTDMGAMKLAIQEAFKGAGFVSPNPLVGCVILDSNNRFISKGYHAKLGEAHAEANAIKGLAEKDLKGAKVFVTLEPCAHEGRTPSCAKALAKFPIAQVIYGLKDPNPLVSGKGAEILESAGIQTLLAEEHFKDESKNLTRIFEQTCEHFLFNQTQKKPFISLKVATSLDGQLALKSGESKWITNESSRNYAHSLRATHDAVLVGAGAISIDNPSLNVRHENWPGKKTKVIVMNPSGSLLQRTDLKIFEHHAPEDIYFVVRENVRAFSKANVIRISSGEFLSDELWTNLKQAGIHSILVEGGAKILSHFLNQKAFQRLYLFQAPFLIGAQSGKAWTENYGLASLSHKEKLKDLKIRGLEGDVFITGRIG